MLIKATELAIKTQDKEKLNYLGNALRNSINSNENEDKVVIFISLIDKYSVARLKILQFYSNPEKIEFAEGYEKKSNVIEHFKNYKGAFLKLNPYIDSIFEKCYKDLYNDGLVFKTYNVIASGTTSDKTTTNLGEELLSFIFENESESV